MKICLLLGVICQLLFLGCGRNRLKSGLDIVNGEEVRSENDFTYLSTVALYSRGRMVCTGTFVGPNHIVTAAHCLEKPVEKIGFGGKGTRAQFSVLKQMAHPSYSNFPTGYDGNRDEDTNAHSFLPLNSRPYDIGVLVFEEEVPEPFQPVGINLVVKNTDVVVAGFGVTSDHSHDGGVLRKVRSNVASIDVPGKEFSLIYDGRGACYGDSGGPVYQNSRGKHSLVGVTSRAGASGNCRSGDGIFSTVDNHKVWIDTAFKSLGKPLVRESDVGSETDAATNPGLSQFSTEDLVVELQRRGWDIVLTPKD